jgi:dipeptidyl aminopeptidase/acylaminoacyl peptidase
MSRVTPADAGLEYEAVEFRSRDDLTLFGWYLRGAKRAAVILVHGHGSKGIVMIYHASAMVAKGYTVLMFDLRAHGSSEGDVCTSGWLESSDLLGALDYLRSRDDVDGDKIGVLGLSLGGQVALRAAAQDESIRAVVAEDPNPAVLGDLGDKPTSLLAWIRYPRN